ncbi:MAG: hypothetical protein H6714_11120 [Myxococcales bacterium]|nr:hypothetical protein [Myxococcales bacterium]
MPRARNLPSLVHNYYPCVQVVQNRRVMLRTFVLDNRAQHEHMNSGPDDVERAWEALCETWSNVTAHRRFIALCQALGQLPEAAKRYRHVVATDFARKAEAQTQLHAVKAAAVASMAAHRSELPLPRYTKVHYLAFGVFLGMLGWTAWAIWESLQ